MKHLVPNTSHAPMHFCISEFLSHVPQMRPPHQGPYLQFQDLPPLTLPASGFLKQPGIFCLEDHSPPSSSFLCSSELIHLLLPLWFWGEKWNTGGDRTFFMVSCLFYHSKWIKFWLLLSLWLVLIHQSDTWQPLIHAKEWIWTPTPHHTQWLTQNGPYI